MASPYTVAQGTVRLYGYCCFINAALSNVAMLSNIATINIAKINNATVAVNNVAAL